MLLAGVGAGEARNRLVAAGGFVRHAVGETADAKQEADRTSQYDQ
jgi:hypothetical protein